MNLSPEIDLHFVQEKLLLDGIEQCSGNTQSKNETSTVTENGEKSTVQTTSTTTSTTTLPTTTTTSTTTTTTTEKQGEASRLIMRTCEDLMNAGDCSLMP